MNAKDDPGLAATSHPGDKVLLFAFNNTSEVQECKRRCHFPACNPLECLHE